MKWKKYAIKENGKITNRFNNLENAQKALKYLKEYRLSKGEIIELDETNRWEKIL